MIHEVGNENFLGVRLFVYFLGWSFFAWIFFINLMLTKRISYDYTKQFVDKGYEI